MQLPQRTPYAHKGELLQVYRSLYTLPEDPSQPDPRLRGLAHVHLFINRAACPHAVESTAAIVQAILLDESLTRTSATSGGQSSIEPLFLMSAREHSIRMSYALAITRFVNSIVDTAQSGFYAQSIATIATRIGLPLAFVEIRHAATHEELPSLIALREAAHASLHWLEMHFWRPTLHSQGDLQDAPMQALSSNYGASSSIVTPPTRAREIVLQESHAQLVPLLRSYKKIAKSVARDASIAGRSKSAMRDLCRRIEAYGRTVGEELASADGARQSWDRHAVKRTREEAEDHAAANANDGDEADDESEADIEAVRILVDELLQPGALIPLAKEKRLRPARGDDGGIPALPEALSAPWTPLLSHLVHKFSCFPVLLIESMVQALAQGAPVIVHPTSTATIDADGAPKISGQSTSYRMTVAAWIVHLIDMLDEQLSAALDERSTDLSHAGTAYASAAATFVAQLCLSQPSQKSLSLVRHLLDLPPSAHVESLLKLAQARIVASSTSSSNGDIRGPPTSPGAPPPIQTGFEDALSLMRSRIADLTASSGVNALQQNDSSAPSAPTLPTPAAEPSLHAADAPPRRLPKGWSLAPPDWQPTPIGMLRGKVPTLIGLVR